MDGNISRDKRKIGPDMKKESGFLEKNRRFRERVLFSLLVAVLLTTAVLSTPGFLFGASAMETGKLSADPDGSTGTDLQEEKIQPEYLAFAFNKNVIQTVDISMPQEEWEELLKDAQARTYKSCDVTVNGKVYQAVGIRTKGNASLSSTAKTGTDRYSFKIDFGEYVEGQTLEGLQKLALNNLAGDATYMKEAVSYEAFAALGVPTPAYAYAQITVNGSPWGLYILNEVVEESFIERTYGSSNGNLYKPESMKMDGEGENGMPGGPDGPGGKPGGPDGPGGKPGGPGGMPEGIQGGGPGGTPGGMPENAKKTGTGLVYKDDSLSSYSGIFDETVFKTTDDADKQRLIAMMKALSTGENIAAHVDVEEVLRYFAANTFLVNLDSYAGSFKHNYYLYEEDGVFSILPWDLHLSFGAFQLTDASKAINFPIDKPVTDTMENSPLITSLLAIPEYLELYHGYLQTLLDTFGMDGSGQTLITKIDGLISEAVSAETRAFYTGDQYEKALAEMKVFIRDRSLSVQAQLDGEQPADAYGSITTTLDLAVMGALGGR